MSEITNKASYLKGLADGMKLDTNTDEGKLLSAIIDAIGDIAEEIESFESETDFIADKLDDLEDVVEVIGDTVFGEDDDENDLYEIKCDNCGQEIELTGEDLDDLFEGNIECPNCGEKIELDLEGIDDCDCGCDHDHDHE